MTELPALYRDEAVLRQTFAEGLERMLAHHPGLGVFILVLANANHDARPYPLLSEALAARFARLAQAMRETLAAGRQPADAPDDVLVFLKLMALGLDALPPTASRDSGNFRLQFNLLRALRPPRMADARVERLFQPFDPDGFHFNRPFLKLMALGLDALPPTASRDSGNFRLQFNLLRALRPPRMADARVERLFQPFDPDGFHFNRPFLRKEVLWEGGLLGRDARLLYNKFPFARLHGLLVIEPEALHPQYLAHDEHQLVWALCERAGTALPGIGFGYNSYGAYASVNHQHFQQFCLEPDQAYPVEAAHWRHNGGGRDYPLPCRCFRDPDAAWRAIADLHQANRAYNLLYRPGRLYLMPRRFQGHYVHSAWTGGFAWAELAGAVTTFNAEDFESLDDAAIRAELARMADR